MMKKLLLLIKIVLYIKKATPTVGVHVTSIVRNLYDWLDK